MPFNKSSASPEQKAPGSLGVTLFGLLFTHALFVGFPAYVAYVSYVAQDYVFGTVCAIGTIAGFCATSPTMFRNELRLVVRLRREILLTRRIKQGLMMIELGETFAGHSLTTDDFFILRRVEKSVTMIKDGTGVYIFDQRPVCVWAETADMMIDLGYDGLIPATFEQLKALAHRLHTYR